MTAPPTIPWWRTRSREKRGYGAHGGAHRSMWRCGVPRGCRWRRYGTSASGDLNSMLFVADKRWDYGARSVDANAVRNITAMI